MANQSMPFFRGVGERMVALDRGFGEGFKSDKAAPWYQRVFRGLVGAENAVRAVGAKERADFIGAQLAGIFGKAIDAAIPGRRERRERQAREFHFERAAREKRDDGTTLGTFGTTESDALGRIGGSAGAGEAKTMALWDEALRGARELNAAWKREIKIRP